MTEFEILYIVLIVIGLILDAVAIGISIGKLLTERK